MKKKTVSFMLIVTLMVFFCANVFGATQTTVVRNKVRRATTVSNVDIEINAVQFYYSNDNVLSHSGSGITTYYNNYSIVVTISITNKNSKSYYLDNFSFNLSFNDDDISSTGSLDYACEIKDIHNFGPDVYISMQNDTGNFTPVPSADWSFLDHICVPANTTLSCVSTLEYTTVAYNNVTSSAKLSAINLTSVSAYETDFTPQGAHDDLLISLEALRSYLSGNSGIPLIDSDLDSILSEVIDGFTAVETRLSNIQSILTWAGTYNLSGFGTRSSVSYTYETGRHVVNVRSFSGIPITDFEVVPPDVVIKDVLYKIPVNVILITNYTEDKSFDTYYLDNLFSASDYYIDQVDIDSSWVSSADFTVNNNAYRLYIRSDGRIIPQGYKVSNIKFYVYSRNSSLVLNTFVVNTTLSSYISDVESQSDSLVNQSNQAHTQEQAFFNQNSQAISNTGLGNYQFDINQTNGISVVTGLFNRLWQSVGSWNSVYVFSLTITVALTILRYTTNAIRRRSYNEDKGGKP